jgi:putative flippase GtrA
VFDCLAEGVDVGGYTYWSLLEDRVALRLRPPLRPRGPRQDDLRACAEGQRPLVRTGGRVGALVAQLLIVVPEPAPRSLRSVISVATDLLDRVTGGRGEKLIRFGTVSVVGIVITQLLLVLLHGVMNEGATLANVLAVSISAIPVFFLNKSWVWGRSGRAHLRREVLPFWAFTLLGLLLSTILVAMVDDRTDKTWPVMLANIAGFGLVWLAKFLFLDQVVFGIAADEDGGDVVADAR